MYLGVPTESLFLMIGTPCSSQRMNLGFDLLPLFINEQSFESILFR